MLVIMLKMEIFVFNNRHIYENLGCKFAPLEVAVRFSQEKRIPECEGIVPFGFHYHLPPGVELV